jgi:hypothetical protein
MTVVLDKDVDIETVKDEIARIEEAQTDETASSDENSDVEPDVEPDVESNAADEPEPVILENNPS